MPHRLLQARQNMVDGQLRPNGIKDNNLLQQFKIMPRELFLEGLAKETPYADMPLPIGVDRFMLSPLMQARMLQCLKLNTSHSVLVIASGTGYMGAITAHLSKHVTLVEENKHFTDISRHAMLELDIRNITTINASPSKGAPQKGPFDRIIINTPLKEIPAALSNQLKNGGEMSALVEGADGLLEITHIIKRGKTLVSTALNETKTLPILPVFQQETGFVF